MFMHRKLVKVNEYMRKLDNNKYKLTKKDFAFVENTVKAFATTKSSEKRD